MPRPPPVRRGGLALRMDHGSQYLSDHFTNQIKFWGILSWSWKIGQVAKVYSAR